MSPWTASRSSPVRLDNCVGGALHEFLVRLGAKDRLSSCVNDTIEHLRNGKDAADDGARGGDEVQRAHALLSVDEEHRRDLVLDEEPRDVRSRVFQLPLPSHVLQVRRAHRDVVLRNGELVRALRAAAERDVVISSNCEQDSRKM